MERDAASVSTGGEQQWEQDLSDLFAETTAELGQVEALFYSHDLETSVRMKCPGKGSPSFAPKYNINNVLAFYLVLR